MSAKSKKILIVEDEISLLRALVEKLSRAGFACIEAKNGKEALTLVKKNKIDLILLDIIMPVMDGLTFLQKIKANEKTKQIPVIILTNLNDDSKIAESQAKGVTDYLIKSNWDIEDVIKKIREKLQ